MEPESSVPHSQVPTTCSYPEPARSSPVVDRFKKIHMYVADLDFGTRWTSSWIPGSVSGTYTWALNGKRRRVCPSRVRLDYCFLTCGSRRISVRETIVFGLRNNDLHDDFTTYICLHVCNCLKSTFFTSARVSFYFVTIFLILVAENAGLDTLNQMVERRQGLSQVPVTCTAMRGVKKV